MSTTVFRIATTTTQAARSSSSSSSLTKMVTSSSTVKTSQAVSSTVWNKTTATPLITTAPPTTTSTSEPVAFATVASLTINQTNTKITAALLADLVTNVSRAVCTQEAAAELCNVTVLSITVNNVTTFCTNGVCPGYTSNNNNNRRVLLGLAGPPLSGINLGIVTKKPIADVAANLNTIVIVVSSNVAPNAPVSNLDQLKDSRSLVQYVIERQTVYVNVLPQATDNTTGTLLAILILVVVISLCVYCCCCRKTKTVIVQQVAPAAQAQQQAAQVQAPQVVVIQPSQILQQSQTSMSPEDFKAFQEWQKQKQSAPQPQQTMPQIVLSNTAPPPSFVFHSPSSIGANARFSKTFLPTALESIRITKENYKPFVKTA